MEGALLTILLEFVVYSVLICGLLNFLEVFAQFVEVDAFVAGIRHDVLRPQFHVLLLLIIHGRGI